MLKRLLKKPLKTLWILIALTGTLGFAFAKAEITNHASEESRPQMFSDRITLLRAGFTIGFNKGTVEPAKVKSTTATNVGGGLLIEQKTSRLIGLESGFLYARKEDEIGNDKIYSSRTTNWIMIPIEPRLHVIPELLSVTAGPYLGFRFGSIDHESKVGNIANVDLGDGSQSRFDFGGTIGAGLNVGLSKKTGIYAELRYKQGLVDLEDSESLNLRTSLLSTFAGLVWTL